MQPGPCGASPVLASLHRLALLCFSCASLSDSGAQGQRALCLAELILKRRGDVPGGLGGKWHFITVLLGEVEGSSMGTTGVGGRG